MKSRENNVTLFNMGKQADEVLGGQPDGVESTHQIIQHALRNIQRRQEEMLGVAAGTREAVERDMPPRFFLLVPPLKMTLSGRALKMFNPCSQTFHMYFVCRAFLDDLKEMENGIPPESMDSSPEFSEPLLVKQSAVRP